VDKLGRRREVADLQWDRICAPTGVKTRSARNPRFDNPPSRSRARFVRAKARAKSAAEGLVKGRYAKVGATREADRKVARP
jgi:hypothetical protein